MTSTETTLSTSGGPRLTTTGDVRLAYRVLLGREAESREALRGKAGRTVPALLSDVLGSREFLEDVAVPLADGSGWSGRFSAAPTPEERRWAALVLTGADGAAAAARGARTWGALFQALLLDADFAARLASAIGPRGLEAFADGLALETLRGALREKDDQEEAFTAGPVLSFLAPATALGPLDLLDAASSLLAQTYPRWELAAAVARPDGTTRLLLEALRSYDARIRIDVLDGPAAEVRGAALDLCSGDYIAALSPRPALDPGVVRRAAAAARGTSRPELIELGGGAPFLIRADVVARLGLQDGWSRVEEAELKTRVLREGGRCDAVGGGAGPHAPEDSQSHEQ